MVPVAFKTVYLFPALFALPHVLAAPGAAALGRSPSIQVEALNLHNDWRTSHRRHSLTWNTNLEALALLHAGLCKNDQVIPLGTPSKGLSLFTEDTHD